MTKPKRHTGFYVTAKHGSGSAATTKTAWLLGPFKTHRAALMMVAAARHGALNTDDPRFAFAAFGTARLTRPIDKPLPPGRLDLTIAVDSAWIGLVITGGFRKD